MARETAVRAMRDFLYIKAHKALFEMRRLRPVSRTMPHFIVIGAQKSGTSSMFSYLKQHPQIVRPILKEPYFFDRQYHRGLSWYGCNFPSLRTVGRLNDRHGRAHLTFEATATYVFDQNVPARIARDLKTRKFILLLRNPVERAISAYWHARRMDIESRSLAEAMKSEMAGEQRPGGRPGYLPRGIYHEAVARWQITFSPDDLLILQSETMFADPGSAMGQVFSFLDLPQPQQVNYTAKNVGRYDGKDAEVRAMLREFYRPHNAYLNSISRTQFSW
jgi:hypothetical protein